MATDERKEIMNRIRYTVMIVRDFGDAYQMTPKQAHNYMRRHKAMDYLSQFYDVEHTFSPEATVTSIREVSNNNGGRL